MFPKCITIRKHLCLVQNAMQCIIVYFSMVFVKISILHLCLRHIVTVKGDIFVFIKFHDFNAEVNLRGFIFVIVFIFQCILFNISNLREGIFSRFCPDREISENKPLAKISPFTVLNFGWFN